MASNIQSIKKCIQNCLKANDFISNINQISIESGDDNSSLFIKAISHLDGNKDKPYTFLLPSLTDELLICEENPSITFNISLFKEALNIPSENNNSNYDEYQRHINTVEFLIENNHDVTSIEKSINDLKDFANENNFTSIPTFKY